MRIQLGNAALAEAAIGEMVEITMRKREDGGYSLIAYQHADDVYETVKCLALVLHKAPYQSMTSNRIVVLGWKEREFRPRTDPTFDPKPTPEQQRLWEQYGIVYAAAYDGGVECSRFPQVSEPCPQCGRISCSKGLC